MPSSSRRGGAPSHRDRKRKQMSSGRGGTRRGGPVLVTLAAQLFSAFCDCIPPGFSVNGDSPSKNTGVGCHFLLQGSSDSEVESKSALQADFFLNRWSHQVLQPSGLKSHLAVFCCSEAARCGTQQSQTGRELEKPTESEAEGALRRGGVWTSASVPQSAPLPEAPALRRRGEDPGAPELPGLPSAAGFLNSPLL